MSKVVSMRVKDEVAERLQRMSRRLGRTPSETGAILLDEALRASEFSMIEFRNSIVGRQAYIRGSSLAVWEVIAIARALEMDAIKTAEYFQWPIVKVHAALNYARAFPDEIDASIKDNEALDFEALKRSIPHIQLFEVQ